MESGGSLEGRVARLEAEVEDHRRALRELGTDVVVWEAGAERMETSGAPSEGAGHVRVAKTAGSAFETRRKASRGWRFELPFEPGDLRSGEWWLNKIGIALLLLGVAFLFKFSLDRGWLTPAVTVGIGLFVGAALLAIGLRIYEGRRAFARVLLGGGVGTFYITGFATFQLYDLISYAVAFAFMVAVTVLAFWLSLRRAGVSLALIGTIGGLGTPFLLYTDEGSVTGLVLYSCLILAGASAIYLYKGWRSLFVVAFAGVWAVFAVAAMSAFASAAPGADKWALQIGAVFGWLTLWLVPAIREALRERDPQRWPLPEPGRLLRGLFADSERILNTAAPIHAASFAGPILALFFTQGIWDLEQWWMGWISLGAAALYALATWSLRSLGGRRIAYTQALVALLLGTLALIFLLDGNALLFALAAEAAALHFVSRRLSDRILSFEAHALFAIAGLWLAVRILAGYFAPGIPVHPFFNVQLLVNLSVVALAFASSTIFSPTVARIYRIIGHATVLGLIAHELAPVTNGETWTFGAWAVYAAGLQLLSRRAPEWGTGKGAHVLWAGIGLWLVERLVTDGAYGMTPVFNLSGIVDLAAIALAVVVSFLGASEKVRLVYRVAAHVALLGWLWHELSMLPDGGAYVTVSWGLYAAVLLVAGLRTNLTLLVRGGMATLFLVVGKLFLVDLAGVEAVWRILLFLGFGGMFLVLSYYLGSLWRPGSGTGGPTHHSS